MKGLKMAKPSDNRIISGLVDLAVSYPATSVECKLCMEAAEAVRDMLEALWELEIVASRANRIQHAGIELDPYIWLDLYNACNGAKAAIARATA
ncbi:MAG: hypothetical protein ABIG68_09805 [Acidobacteriota bacterium]